LKGIVGLGLSAVVAAGSSAQTPRIRDSAGVRIIENGPRLTAPGAFQLAEKPSFDVGGLHDDPVDELSPRPFYVDAVRLSNAHVAVLDTFRVVFYDAAGKRIKAFGRRGRGPGEFVAAAGICATRGDTVLVTQERQTMTRLTKNGTFVSTSVPPNGVSAEPAGCFEDGTYVGRQRSGRNTDGASRWLYLRAGSAAVMNTITEETHPVSDALVVALGAAVARGNRLYLATPDRFEVRAFDPSGQLKEIIRTSDPLVPMTADDKSRMPLRIVAGQSSGLDREAQRKRAIADSKIKYWPTLGRMLVDADNRIWIQDWTPSDDPTWPQGWTAFDSSGTLLGRLMIPAARSKVLRHYVVHFGKNEVFLYRIDEDGAAHYTAYPILSLR
jgi:hypothetical protein